MPDLKKAILDGDLEGIKRCLMKDKNSDVNQNIGLALDWQGDYVKETPLSASLQKIKSENDEWFQVSRMLLQHKNIDVNTECGKEQNCTILAWLCRHQSESTLGVQMLLEDRRTDVNRGNYTPLYHALKRIEMDNDYFH